MELGVGEVAEAFAYVLGKVTWPLLVTRIWAAQRRTWFSTCSGSGQHSSDGVNDRTGMTQDVLALEPPESTDG